MASFALPSQIMDEMLRTLGNGATPSADNGQGGPMSYLYETITAGIDERAIRRSEPEALVLALAEAKVECF
jgi:hypothetical protein